MSLKVDIKNVLGFVSEDEIKAYEGELKAAQKALTEKTGKGSDYLGWVDLPNNYDKEEFARIKKSAEKIKSDSDVLIVIGIGGSYLGSRAAIELLRSPNYNLIKKDTPQIYFVGNYISPSYTKEIMSLIEGKDFSINVISKSGTTTEPAIAFRIFKELIEKKYGKKEAKNRIYATTDKQRGALKKLSDAEGYESFVIPDDIGGRYSVLTAVGLLPIAVAGIDIEKVMQGAALAAKDMSKADFTNPAYLYAATRNALYRKNKTVEILAAYEPSFRFMSEWWKQLYGESEGKEQKGIFPASVDLTADLHSMGQYIQEGLRNIFETVVNFETTENDITIEQSEENIDGLNFVAGKTMHYVNQNAFLGTILAHVDGGVPNIIINIDKITEENYGYMVYFFEYSCGLSGYLLGVNPFDQPGVEAYKVNMFALLGKPGYEKERENLLKRLEN